MGLFVAVKFLIARCGAFLPIQGRVNPLLHKGLPSPFNCHATDMKALMYLLIGPSGSLWALVGLQKNAGSRLFVSGRFPFGNQRENGLSFLTA